MPLLEVVAAPTVAEVAWRSGFGRVLRARAQPDIPRGERGVRACASRANSAQSVCGAPPQMQPSVDWPSMVAVRWARAEALSTHYGWLFFPGGLSWTAARAA